MCKNSRTAVRVEGVRSEWFDSNVGVHQGSILSFFLFAVVLNEMTMDVRGRLLKEILYADNLVLLKTGGKRWKKGI